MSRDAENRKSHELPGASSAARDARLLTPKPDVEEVERAGLREAFGRREGKPYTREDYERDKAARGRRGKS